jgi:RNA polymerase sigma-70 factor (ECF subfamily)
MTDVQGFEAFVRRYQDMVYGTAVRLLGSPAEAEDVAQAVFLKAFQRSAEVVDSPAAPGWLKTTTRNLCLNHLSRYRARWQFFSELTRPERADRPDKNAGGEYADSLVSPGSHALDLEHAELREELERALRALPDHQRVPLVLFHFDELSYQEIADALGASVGKVKTDIHRGREALKRLLPDRA